MPSFEAIGLPQQEADGNGAPKKEEAGVPVQEGWDQAWKNESSWSGVSPRLKEEALVLTPGMTSDEIVDLAGKLAKKGSEERETEAERSFGEQVALERRMLRGEIARALQEKTGKPVNPDEVVFSQDRAAASSGTTERIQEGLSRLLENNPKMKRFIGGLLLTGTLSSLAMAEDAKAGWLEDTVKVAFGGVKDGASSGTRRAGDIIGDTAGGIIKDATRDFLNASGFTQESKDFQQNIGGALRDSLRELDSIERDFDREIREAKTSGISSERLTSLERRKASRLQERALSQKGRIEEMAANGKAKGLRMGDENMRLFRDLEQRIVRYNSLSVQESGNPSQSESAPMVESESARELKKIHSEYTRDRARINERFALQKSREKADQKNLEREYDQSLMELYSSYGWRFAEFAKMNAGRDKSTAGTAFRVAESLEAAFRVLQKKYNVELSNDPLDGVKF